MAGRRPKKEEVHVASIKANICTAFTKRKKCPICGDSLHPASYREHVDACELNDNDSDCQIVAAVSGEESRAMRAGPAIELDEDNCSPQNETFPHEDAENRGVNEAESEKSDPVPVRRRSSRILVQKTGEVLIKQEENADQPHCSATTSAAIPENGGNKSYGGLPPKPRRPKRGSKGGGEKTKVPRKTRKKTPPTSRPEMDVDSPAIEPPSPQLDKTIPIELKRELPRVDSMLEKIECLLAEKPSPIPDLNVTNVTEDPAVARGAPYFVTFVLRMMKKVLCAFDAKFWGTDLIPLNDFLDLSSDARQLFMRMFLRKRMWLTSERLKQRYTELAATLEGSLKTLEEKGFLDNSQKQPPSLETLLKLLPLPNMKNVAKIFQLDIMKGKPQLAADLESLAAKQRGIFGQTVGTRMLQTVNRELGPCHRVNEKISLLFKAIFTLYSPTETNSALAIDTPHVNLEQAMLFLMLQIETGKTKLPSPDPCPRMIDIYRNKRELMLYVEAKELEISILSLSSCYKYEEATKLGDEAKLSLTGGDGASLLAHCSTLPVYIRRFTCPWVLTRCVGHAASILEKQKKFALAVYWQRFLLTTKLLEPYCVDSRGLWWDRLALNLDSHLKEKEEALESIENGLRDEAVKEKDRLLLQDRAVRLTRGAFTEHIQLTEIEKREIMGEVLSKELGETRVNRFIIRNGANIEECSVEEVVRKHYLSNEQCHRGVHAEGAIWHTVLGLLFYDVIFKHDLSHLWISELQRSPLDLNYGMYSERSVDIENRLSWLETADIVEVRERIEETWRIREGEENSEIHWTLFESHEDCASFVSSCPRSVLVGVFRRLFSDYRATRSGFPDLTLWNTEQNTVTVVEVKGPGDRLSTKQRLWLNHFRQLGARAEVCHVIAKNGKELK